MNARRVARTERAEKDRSEFERWRGSVDERLDRVIDDHAEERNEARAHRQALREVIAALSQSVTTLAENVRRMEPTVADYRDKAAEARGAAKLGKVIWAALVSLGAILGAVGAEVIRMIRG